LKFTKLKPAVKMERAVAYSHALKRKQIKDKRMKKKEKLENMEKLEKKEELKYLKELGIIDQEIESEHEEEKENQESIQQDKKSLNTVFTKMSQKEIEINIAKSREPLEKLSTTDEEYTYIPDFTNFIEIPKRPHWNQNSKSQEIEENEKIYFTKYIEEVKSNFKELNYFEQNIEVFRQLWRTIEFSDAILLIVDVRHPLFHFPPSLYNYLVNELKKPMILILNKCDLVSENHIESWKNFFQENYPKLHCLTFSSFKNSKKSVNQEEVKMIWNKLSEIFKNDETTVKYISEMFQEKSNEKHTKDYVTIGLLGHPNVGKSCVLNSLVGKHVVSTSSTPGHTKHYQTIFVSQHVRLCDCPGLVFPAHGMPKELQILCGLYPIAQVSEPYTSVMYFAQRVDLISLLNLKHPRDEDIWSAWDICESYTIKCGFYQTQGRMPDVYRGANELLRMIFSGKILFCFSPPLKKK
jgi:ribosome biogenesis GTPase A